MRRSTFGRAVRQVSLAAFLSLLTWGAGGAAPAAASVTPTGGRVTPNRFDPVSRTASVAPPPATAPAPASRRPTGPRRAPAGRLDPGPATVTLDPSKPVRLTSSDSALKLDIPAGAVSPGDVAAAGGRIDLRVREVAPPSGATAGGSGHVTFGTWLVQALDASGQPSGLALRRSVGVRLHVGGRTSAFDLTHAVAVIGGPLPRAVAGVAAPAATTAGSPTNRGRVVTRRPAVDVQNHVLSTSADVSGFGTMVSFDTAAPVAAFGGPDPTEINLGAGALVLANPLSRPAGPGGLTRPSTSSTTARP